MSTRPPIPAPLKRQILIESGHRCAIPTCRQIICEVHHIVPWSTCKKHEASNLITLCSNCHTLAHDGKIDSISLKAYKAKLQKLHDVYTAFEVDVLFECYHQDKAPFSFFLYLLVKRLLDSGFIRIQRTGVQIIAGGIDNSPCFLVLTPEGREYVQALLSSERF